MARRILAYVALVGLAACQLDNSTPSGTNGRPPDLVINDGAHSAGNPDFFFLVPMVLPTTSYANFTPNGFNKDLTPTVEICLQTATTPGGITPATPAPPAVPTSDGCSSTFTRVILSGPAVKKHFRTGSEPSGLPAGFEDVISHYHAEYLVNGPCGIYRVWVKQGSKVLGYADVQCVTSLLGLLKVDYKNFGAVLKGTKLQIPFRVEQFALCDVPGVGPCGTAASDFTAETHVSYVPTGGTTPSGVTIPIQTGIGGAPAAVVAAGGTGIANAVTPTVFTITVATCDPLNPRATDLPVFGNCIRVTSDPALPPEGLTAAATVFICDLHIAETGVAAEVFSHEQEHRITMHRLDEAGEVQTVTALPHTTGCPVTISAVDWSVKGIFRDLVHGRLRSAGSQVLAMVSPQPLYARRLNQGGGGLTKGFSDFQHALPAKLEITAGNGQSALPGTPVAINPVVTVRDLGGEPVRGARVRFLASGNGLPNPAVAVMTAADGIASVPWTLATAAGPNSLTASGRGLAGSDLNGPREGVDPFQPIQAFFDGADPVGGTVQEPVLTGAVTFNAFGLVLMGSSSSGGGHDAEVEPNPGSLFSINHVTGVATLIGAAGVLSHTGVAEVSGVEFDPTTGTLYGIAGSAIDGAKLITINPSTGAGTLIGSFVGAGFSGTGSGSGSDAIAIASDGTMYAGGWNGGFTGGSFLRIDKSTGAVLAAFATTAGIHLSGLAFDASGTLWASRGGNGPGQIHTINLANGQTLSTVTLKTAALAPDPAIVSDLAFGPDGFMYAALPRESQLARIDLTTGVLTRIGSLGAAVNKLSGLAALR